MELIDWFSHHIASKPFTSTALTRAHASKSFNNLWYTDAQVFQGMWSDNYLEELISAREIREW